MHKIPDDTNVSNDFEKVFLPSRYPLAQRVIKSQHLFEKQESVGYLDVAGFADLLSLPNVAYSARLLHCVG